MSSMCKCMLDSLAVSHTDCLIVFLSLSLTCSVCDTVGKLYFVLKLFQFH